MRQEGAAQTPQIEVSSPEVIFRDPKYKHIGPQSENGQEPPNPPKSTSMSADPGGLRPLWGAVASQSPCGGPRCLSGKESRVDSESKPETVSCASPRTRWLECTDVRELHERRSYRRQGRIHDVTIQLCWARYSVNVCLAKPTHPLWHPRYRLFRRVARLAESKPDRCCISS